MSNSICLLPDRSQQEEVMDFSSPNLRLSDSKFFFENLFLLLAKNDEKGNKLCVLFYKWVGLSPIDKFQLLMS